MSRVWTRQPQVFVGPSALARQIGITHLITGVSGALYDVVSRTFPLAIGTGVVREMTSRGVGVRSSGAGAYWDIPVDPTLTTNRQAWIWVGRVTTSGAIILRDNTSTGGTIPFWHNSGFDMRNGGTDYTAAGTFNTGQDYNILTTFGNTYAQLWVDGVPITLSTSTAVSGDTSPFKLARNGSVGSIYDITTVLLARFSNPIGTVLARSLSRNPWQLFEPLRTPVRGFEPTAAAGTVFNPLSGRGGGAAQPLVTH